MKTTFAAAALAAAAALTGCSVSTPAPAESTQSSASPSVRSSDASTPRASTGAGNAAAGAKEACELFNKLFADYAAVSPTDAKGYEDVYLKAQDAKGTVSGDLEGLFASLSLLAIDHSAAAESGGTPAQESKDAVRDAVFANSGTCTAEGVTLRL
ncbi:hypothetical protein [Pseudarthrobacter sp. efr-133-R2A-89]|uniref:hypothetical protein n=1 Tax=Pseudarthrobacter sp. efr-133-R2A-89 TaxID=3040302 RepID=UPI00255509A9|nr:hypothetical protein [Pseudarthrobacter sp. efr-133-R2A-89]